MFNRKLHKTPLPSEQQVILGCLYDSTARLVKSTNKKVTKYISRIDEALETVDIPVKKVMSLHGNLVFAAAVAPFGKPFLAALSNLVIGKSTSATVRLTPIARMCRLRIWKQLLLANEGLGYDFILGRLPRAKYDIFFDASPTWGIGGYCGSLYFKISWDEINPFFDIDVIARKELLAAVVALWCFSSAIHRKIVAA